LVAPKRALRAIYPKVVTVLDINIATKQVRAIYPKVITVLDVNIATKKLES
jgi:hypothetical protein